MKVGIQGELGSNSHMAALAMLGATMPPPEIVPCSVSAEVFERIGDGSVASAVLPIENSLHGSVAEHYDLLLEHAVRIDGESLLRIRHNLIARPGARLEGLRRILSHPVALAQCRRFLARHREIHAVPFYDTAGSVKHVMDQSAEDAAAIAPLLAARQYGAEVLLEGIEDHPDNFTRFHLIVRDDTPLPEGVERADKMSLAFTVEHRPGTLVAALRLLGEAGVDLSKIESRPIPGMPWAYIFHVDLRFGGVAQADRAVAALRAHCGMVKEFGRYIAA